GRRGGGARCGWGWSRPAPVRRPDREASSVPCPPPTTSRSRRPPPAPSAPYRTALKDASIPPVPAAAPMGGARDPQESRYPHVPHAWVTQVGRKCVVAKGARQRRRTRRVPTFGGRGTSASAGHKPSPPRPSLHGRCA